MKLISKSIAVIFILSLVFPVIASAQSSPEPVQRQRLLLQARLSAGGKILTSGVEWRIFGSQPKADGEMPELGYGEGGAKAFNVAPGEYIIHVAFGHAGAVKKITVGNKALVEEFILNAGGVRLFATTPDGMTIPAHMLKFNIYEQETDRDGNRSLLARDLKSATVAVLPAGTYHVVSYYGDLNASVRADLHIQPGKLTDATLQHRAANLAFRLVRARGGDAVANTSWLILTENGEVIRESNRTFPSMILAEGKYTAIAKHNDAIYSEDFQVHSGFDKEVEVLAPL